MNFQNQIDYGKGFGIDILGGIPELPPLNSDTLKSHIMFKCGLLTPLYSEPETMRDAFSHWFSCMRYDIDRMLALAETEYLPLENYRRNETENVTRTGNGSNVVEHTGTISDDGTITDEYSSEKERMVSAYNDDEYAPGEKENVRDGRNERSIDTARTFSNSDTETRSDTGNETRTRLYYGNIGTMTSQDMFNQELDLLERFNPYDWIVSRIETDLFLSIW